MPTWALWIGLAAGGVTVIVGLFLAAVAGADAEGRGGDILWHGMVTAAIGGLVAVFSGAALVWRAFA